MTSGDLKRLARECGFELAGVAAAEPLTEDNRRYLDWVEQGMAGAMGYLSGRRAAIRTDPKLLLDNARSIICVAKLYNHPAPRSTEVADPTCGWISRYAWGEDYHDVLRRALERLVEQLPQDHNYKICVDTAPLLERSYARQAGLGWVGKNTCLINQEIGSWIFLGEVLTTLEFEADSPPPDRCGTCTACIDACPTQAIAPAGYELDARRCISYFTIELRGTVPEEMRSKIGRNVFGCDICQDVCPWNRKAPVSEEMPFPAQHFAPRLEEMASLSEQEYCERFANNPVLRARYSGFLRNAALAMANSGQQEFHKPLERLAQFPNEMVSEHARWGLAKLEE